ncbi:MAG: DUF4214 domain-containing protein [Rhodovarius sp.]|nr:DUF4214 domain-containing protein [Rhodovarius sp.]MCX7932151.1 DUF4214 domain-containing protein [Rhodovarius sp.]MDW8314661.1 DUF4214 domain-containing protein [Rhodovarius sp.]
MASLRAADLLYGSDHDFVINLYLAVLGRWPDEEGYQHFRAMAAEGQEGRLRAIHAVVTSPEALQRGRSLVIEEPLLPSPPEQALAAQLALRTEFLHGLIRQQAARSAPPPPLAMAEPLVRELRAELAALRRELQERLAELAPPAVPPPAAAVEEPAAGWLDQVQDMIALAEARLELRLRALEKRLG